MNNITSVKVTETELANAFDIVVTVNYDNWDDIVDYVYYGQHGLGWAIFMMLKDFGLSVSYEFIQREK